MRILKSESYSSNPVIDGHLRAMQKLGSFKESSPPGEAIARAANIEAEKKRAKRSLSKMRVHPKNIETLNKILCTNWS